MKKILLVIAALVMVGGGLFLGFRPAKAEAPSAPLIAPPPGYFQVDVRILPNVDRQCLECLNQVVLWQSDGTPQSQTFVYNTWVYTFWVVRRFAVLYLLRLQSTLIVVVR